ncbi:hypothetical protein MCOR25_006088 [Pyricularia grisea]|nr:hypothetical protein MCOR25_006088 [Pyricularia grisea]
MSSLSGDVSVSDTTQSLPGWVYITARPGHFSTSLLPPQVETVIVKLELTNATKIVTETSTLQPTTEVVVAAESITPIAAAANSTNDDRVLSPGAIAGLVIGSAFAGVVVFCLAWLWFVCWKRRQRQKENGETGTRHTLDPWLLIRGSGRRPMEVGTFGQTRVHTGLVPRGSAADDKLVVAEGEICGGQTLSSMRRENVVPCYAPGRDLRPQEDTRPTVPSPSIPHPSWTESQRGSDADPVSPMSPRSTISAADSFIPSHRNTNSSPDGKTITRQIQNMHSLPESHELDSSEIFTTAENPDTRGHGFIIRTAGLSPPPLLRVSPPVDDFRQPQSPFTSWAYEPVESAAANSRRHSPYRAVNPALHHGGSREEQYSPSSLHNPQDQRVDSPGHRATLRATPKEVENGVHAGSWSDLSLVD